MTLMKNKFSIAAVVLYLMGVVVTFGHAPNAPVTIKVDDPSGYAFTRALFGPCVWPLYWSCVAWEKQGGQTK